MSMQASGKGILAVRVGRAAACSEDDPLPPVERKKIPPAIPPAIAKTAASDRAFRIQSSANQFAIGFNILRLTSAGNESIRYRHCSVDQGVGPVHRRLLDDCLENACIHNSVRNRASLRASAFPGYENSVSAGRGRGTRTPDLRFWSSRPRGR